MFPTNRGKPRLRVGLARRPWAGPSTPRTASANPIASACSAPAPAPSVPAPPVPRQPLQSVKTQNPLSMKQNTSRTLAAKETAYFAVLYTKRSKKKRKSWIDGYIILKNDRKVDLQNEDAKTISTERFSKPLGGLKDGNTLEIGSWELEVQNEVLEDEYISGRVFAPPVAVSASRNGITKPIQMQQKPFKPVRCGTTSPSVKNDPRKPTALYDATAPDAQILLPQIKHAGIATVPIVLDPFLSRRMRVHQHEGVKFLFEATVGRKVRTGEGGEGAILADEMGLGKTLQAIALIWTMLKQGLEGKPIAKKVIIISPASLVRNWENEVRKWLGDERLKPVALESGSATFESKRQLAAFLNGKTRNTLIISYESFRTHVEDFVNSRCDLMICDEGHRLKSAVGNKTIDALRKMSCKKRVILSGTPIQNDLEEFYAVCDFVNPGCLNNLASFRGVFAKPILASRDCKASASVKAVGEARAKELSRITSQFVLRRSSTLLEKYLPPKHESAIFVRLEEQQEVLYKKEARRWYMNMTDGQWGKTFSGDALSAINSLRKICAHPCLISDDNAAENSKWYENVDEKASSKMQVTLSICKTCVDGSEKIIVVSNFTKTLDVLEGVLTREKIRTCRLDGTSVIAVLEAPRCKHETES